MKRWKEGFGRALLERLIVGAMVALLAAAGTARAADPLATTFATLNDDITKFTPARQVPHLASQSKPAPVIDGVIGADEYTWSQLVVNNGQNSATAVTDGSDGYGDCTVNASGTITEPTDTNDLSFTVYLAHDDANLYIAVRVIDDVLENTHLTQSYQDDAVELGIDADDTRNGQQSTAAGKDRPGLAGGKMTFASSADGGAGVGDADLNATGANAYGPTFTLPDGTLGRVAGTQLGTNLCDTNPNPNPATDVQYYMKRDNPLVNGNRSLEIRIPKSGLSYSRTDKANPDPAHAGTFINNIIGLYIAVDDDDNGTPRDHQMLLDNACENILGTENILNADGTTWGTVATRATTNYDSTNGGVFDSYSYAFEAGWPRFQLLPSSSGVEDWRNAPSR
ncbi:MAG: hypothetical protein NTW86_09255 [Candidatus Sumerlaeota bacterium]|nr:hypothetical protein [Candidatus Sumerlaeota bacterium]